MFVCVPLLYIFLIIICPWNTYSLFKARHVTSPVATILKDLETSLEKKQSKQEYIEHWYIPNAAENEVIMRLREQLDLEVERKTGKKTISVSRST